MPHNIACHNIDGRGSRYANPPTKLVIQPGGSRALLLRLMWLGAGLAFVLLSAEKIKPKLHFSAIRNRGEFASTDSYLAPLTGVSNPSARLLKILDRLPQDKSVVLVVPDDGPRSAFIEQNVAYLSWPREVIWLCANVKQPEQALFNLRPSSLAAVIFWEVTPFARLKQGIRVGATQVIVPLAAPVPAQ